MRESTKATRATILQSAKEIFLECGYQEASMRKIAARAGITPGAIQAFFREGRNVRRDIRRERK